MADELERKKLFCENCEKAFLLKGKESQNCPFCDSPLWVIEFENERLI